MKAATGQAIGYSDIPGLDGAFWQKATIELPEPVPRFDPGVLTRFKRW